MQLFTSFERALAGDELTRYRELVRRRARREPVSYILGEREFMGITFTVTPAVLTPRPETEILVEEVIRRITGPKEKRSAVVFKQIDLETLRAAKSETASLDEVNAAMDAYAAPHPDDKETATALDGSPPENGSDIEQVEEAAGDYASPGDAADAQDCGAAFSQKAATVLDIGTGSGCIAIGVAVQASQTQLVATDISPEALAVARENAARAKVVGRIDFREGDVFAPLTSGETFDYILANPPYVAEGDEGVWPEVADFEPHGAVYADEDGLAIIWRIIEGVEARLNLDGVFMMEIGAGQAARVIERLTESTTLTDVHTLTDYDGIERVIVATKAK